MTIYLILRTEGDVEGVFCAAYLNEPQAVEQLGRFRAKYGPAVWMERYTPTEIEDPVEIANRILSVRDVMMELAMYTIDPLQLLKHAKEKTSATLKEVKTVYDSLITEGKLVNSSGVIAVPPPVEYDDEDHGCCGACRCCCGAM